MPHELVDQETGEVISAEHVEYAYTRDGRRLVGKEFPNPIPMEPPLGFVDHKPIHELIREMVVRTVSAQAEAEGFETAEEADDFDTGDEDADPFSPWEETFEPDLAWPPSKQVAEAESEAVAAQAEVTRLEQALAEARKVAGEPRRGEGGAEPPPVQPNGGATAPPPPPAKPG